jgi:hypothetical protein
MLEKRWLPRIGSPPVVLGLAVAGMVIAGAVGSSRSPQEIRSRAALVREVATRAELRKVAPDVAERAWLAERGDGRWLFGQAGAATIHSLPRGEIGVAIGDRYVASTTVRAGTSHVVLREWRTGSVVAEIDAPMRVSAGAFRGDTLLVTGYTDAAATNDGGFGLIETSPTGYRQVVTGGAFPTGLGKRPVHGAVLVSPNGAYAATNACGSNACVTQVIDIDRGTVIRTLSGEGFLRALTDEAVVLTDGDFAWISAVSIRTGRELWRQTDSILMTPLAAADGSVTGLIGSEPKGWAVARIDLSGRIHDLTSRTRGGAWPQVWTQLSTARTAVIGHGDFGSALADGARPTADLFDVGRGVAVGRNVLVLPAE